MMSELSRIQKSPALPPGQNCEGVTCGLSSALDDAIAIAAQAPRLERALVTTSVPEGDPTLLWQRVYMAVVVAQAFLTNQIAAIAECREVPQAFPGQVITCDAWRQGAWLRMYWRRLDSVAADGSVFAPLLAYCDAQDTQDSQSCKQFGDIVTGAGWGGGKSGDRDRGCENKGNKFAVQVGACGGVHKKTFPIGCHDRHLAGMSHPGFGAVRQAITAGCYRISAAAITCCY